MAIQELPISSIRTDGGTQMRAQLDLATIAEYTDAMQRGDVFPAIVVFYDGADYWNADGFQRLEAAKHAERGTITADVRAGTRRDAILYAVGANANHGDRRKQGDARRAVEALLADSEWHGKSDTWIAAQCKVTQQYVSKIHSDWRATYNCCGLGTKREGLDGKSRSAPVFTSDPAPAFEPVATWPTVSIGRIVPSEPEPKRDWGYIDYEPEDEPPAPITLPRRTVADLVGPIALDRAEYLAPPPVDPDLAPWRDRVADAFANTAGAKADPLTAFMVKLGAYRLIDDDVVAAWLASTSRTGRIAGRDTLIGIKEWAEHTLTLINKHDRTGLRVVSGD